MTLKNMIKKRVLNKDEVKFYKDKYNSSEEKYQNSLKKLENKESKDLNELKELFNEIKDYSQKINEFENLFVNEDNIKRGYYLANFYNVNDLLLAISNLRMANERIKNENDFLNNHVKYLSEKINESYESKDNNNLSDDALQNFYEKEIEFYKNEYIHILKKQEEYNQFINLLLFNNMQELSNKENIYEKMMKEFKLHKINLAYILSGFPTLSETFVLNEIRWLKKNNYNVKVFCYNDPPNPVTLDFDLEVIRFDKGGNVHENLERLLIEHEIDLIHTHFVFPTGTLYTYPIANKLKIPFTLFAHAFDIFVEENDKKNNIKEISQSEFCKGIFTLSNYHKNYLIEREVPKNKIVVTRQATEYKIHPLKEKKNSIKNIVSISRFVEKKGLSSLIDAAKILQNEDFIFSIYGFGNLEKDLQKQINDLELTNISIKGKLNNPQEVKKVFDNSDLFVSPCIIAKNGDRDGIPTVIFESMAYGVPVLTTNVSAIPEVISNGENGFLVNPNNPYELARKIIEIKSLSQKELYEIRKQAQYDVQNIANIKKTMQVLLNTWEKTQI